MNSDDLTSVGHPAPNNRDFVFPGATVWLRNGSGTPLRVVHVADGRTHVAWWNGSGISSTSFPIACMTPEPGGQS